jgi:hypothetical protein
LQDSPRGTAEAHAKCSKNAWGEGKLKFVDSEQIFKAVRLAERLTERLNAAVERTLSAYFSVNVVLSEENSSEFVLQKLLERRSGGWQCLAISESEKRTIGVDVRTTNDCEQVGTGIHHQSAQKMNRKAAKFFLQPAELDWLAKTSKAHRNFHLLRLLTIKEALFKCDKTNQGGGRSVAEYQTDNPQALAGTAHHPDLADVRFYYATTDLDNGLVSVAVAVKRNCGKM